MAITKVTRTLLSTGIVDNSNATAITIDSSENVGIGTGSPASKLHIFDGGSSVNNTITFGNPSATPKGEIKHTAAGNEFLNISCKGTQSGFGNIAFYTGATPDERMRIDSAGRVGLGSQITSNQASTYDSRANDFVVSGGGDTGITIAGGSSEDIRISFTANGTTGLSKGSITYDNNADTLAIETGGTQRIRIDSDGLKFGSDTAAANALDDYEEGTWTPVITSHGGSNNAALTANEARYTRIGALVYISAFLHGIDFSDLTDGTYVQIHGLPYATDADNYSPLVFGYNNTNIAGGYVEQNGFVYLNSTAGTEFQQQNNDITPSDGSARFMIGITLNLNV